MSSTPKPFAERTVRARRVLALVALGIALSVAFFTGREPRGPTARLDSDAYYYYVALPSLFIDHDLDLSNQYAAHGNWYGFTTTPAGRPGNVFGVGPALMAAPLFLVGRGIAYVTGDRTDGFSRPEILCTLFASVVATFAAVLVTARFVRRRLGEEALALVAAISTLLAGPVVYYAIRQPGYAHPFATLCTALLIDAWDESYEGPRPRRFATWCKLGALFGASVLARPQLATWGLLLAFALFDDLRRAREGARLAIAGRVAAAIGCAAIVVTPQLLAWRAIYGRMLLVPQGGGFMRWTEPALTEVLFSARNGLFAWAPFYGLAALGLLVRARSRVGAALLAGVALQVFVNGAAWDWWAGGSFGGRRFCSCYVAFAFGAAALYLHARRWLEARFAGAAAPLGLGIATLTASCNVALALSYASSTVRITGGEPASLVMRQRLGKRVGAVYGALSDIETAPARAAFALRYGAPWSAYDAVVGVHQLDELFPGLNIQKPTTSSETRLDGSKLPPFALGFVAGAEGASMRSAEAKLLIALNERRESLALRVDASAPLTIAWNGARVPTSREASVLTATLTGLRRGVNVLEFAGAGATTVRSVRIDAIDARSTKRP